MNVASFTLVALRGEGVRGQAMQAPTRGCGLCCGLSETPRTRPTRPGM
ncbi:hypothetical protein ACIBVL_25760 [Streptomyces sp. NPDC049687]